MQALIPSTRKILKILDPTALPKAISVLFFEAATIEVASSGNEVAKATTKSPNWDSESPS